MKYFKWCIDSKNFIFNNTPENGANFSDQLPTKEFINSVCKQIDFYAETYPLSLLQSGKIKHCHAHDPNKPKSEAYNKLFQKLNTKLGEQEIFIEPKDILQLCLDNIRQTYRCYGYVINNEFFLFYLDPYHKTYPKIKKQNKL